MQPKVDTVEKIPPLSTNRILLEKLDVKEGPIVKGDSTNKLSSFSSNLRMKEPSSLTSSGFPSLKIAWPFPNFDKPQRFWTLRSKVTVFMVGWMGKFFLSKRDSIQVKCSTGK
jgi:hypothetical protein